MPRVGHICFVLRKRACDLAQSCTLQTLTPEVARAGEEARALFAAKLRAVADAVVSGPASATKPATRADVLVALATLVGAVTMARAVADEPLALTIAKSAERQLLGHEC